MKKFVLFLVVFLLFLPKISFGQEKTATKSFRPQSTVADPKIEALALKKKITELVWGMKYAPVSLELVEYAAIGKDSLQVCSPDRCEDAESGLEWRHMGEGRCEDAGSFKKVCTALRSNTCDQITGWERGFCQAVTEGQISTLLAFYASAEFKELRLNVDKGDAARQLALYYGYKAWSQEKDPELQSMVGRLKCESYMSDPGNGYSMLGRMVLCKIIFAKNPQEELGNTEEDLAFFDLSRKEGNMDYCQQIKDNRIKKVCLDPKVKKITGKNIGKTIEKKPQANVQK